MLLPAPAGPSMATIMRCGGCAESSRAGRRNRGSLLPPTRRPRSRTPSRETRPAIAPSIAIRWSPRLSTVPPRSRVGTPRTRKPSGVARMCAPSARSASVVVSIRSVSFARSSSAPRTTLSPCAIEASEAKSGSSSTSSGTSAASIVGRDQLGERTSRSATGSPPTVAAVVDGDPRAHPLEDVEEAGARRVDVDAVDVELGVRQQRRRDDERRRRGEVAGHVDRQRAASRSTGHTRRRAVARARRARPAARASARCGRASAPARRPSSGRRRRRGRRAGSPTSPARSRRAARSGSARSAPPSIVERRVPVGRLDARAHLAQRHGDPLHAAASESDSSPASSNAPVLAGEDARRAAASACRRSRSRAARPARAARAGPRPWTRTTSSATSIDLDAELPRDRRSPTRCRPRGRSRGSRSRRRRSRRAGRARWQIHLTPGTASAPRERARPARRASLRRSPAPRRRRSPAPRAAPRRARPRPRRRRGRERAAALGREVLQLEVLDVDPLRAERLEDPGEHARPVGDVDAQPLQRAGVLVGGRRACRRRLPPASPIQRARKPASPRCERRLELLDPAPVLGERGGERLAVLEEDVDPDPRVRAGDRASCRAASRRRRRADRARRRAVAPAWLRSTFASACGRWLVTATSRSCASGSIATGRPPSARHEAVDDAGSAPARSRASGVRNHVAPSKSSAFARSGPRVSAPQIGWPPTKRASPAAAAQTAPFVEPTSVTVLSVGASGERRREPGDGSDATGAATSARSAPATASASEPAALDRAALGRDAEAPPGRDPSRVTRATPARSGGEAGRRADQPRPDDGERADQGAPSARISSATRNARSSDWLAFSRGSQSVS